MLSRINKRQETFKRILEEYPHTPMRVLAEKYGKSPSAIESLIRRHGVKKNAGAKRQDSRVRYPKAERMSSVKARQQGIIQDYPYYTNEELAKKYETTIGTIKSVAEKYHLRKDCQYFHELHQEIQRKRLAAYAWRDTREMAFELGITSASLRQMARSLGIKKIRKPNRSDASK